MLCLYGRKRLTQEAKELENRLAFYETDKNYAEKALDTKLAIKENEIKQLELKNKKMGKNDKERIDWVKWKEKYETNNI